MSVHERDAIYSTNSKGDGQSHPKGQPITRESKEALGNECRIAKCPTQASERFFDKAHQRVVHVAWQAVLLLIRSNLRTRRTSSEVDIP